MSARDAAEERITLTQRFIPLHRKLFFIILPSAIMLLMGMYITSRLVLLSGYINLEHAYTSENLKRLLSAYQTELFQLESTVYDWAVWDDTYAFVQDRNEEFVTSNLSESSLEGIHLELMLFFNAAGALVYGKTVNLELSEEESLAILARACNQHDFLSWVEGEPKRRSGLLPTDMGVFQVATHPILTSEEKGPSQGMLVVGRMFDESAALRLADHIKLNVSLYPPDHASLPAPIRAMARQSNKAQRSYIAPVDFYTIRACAILDDVFGNPVTTVSIETPRKIYAQGVSGINYFTMVLALMIIALCIFLLIGLNREVLHPIVALCRDVARITASGDISKRLTVSKTQNEIAILSDEINDMLATLERSEERLGLSLKTTRDLTNAIPSGVLILSGEEEDELVVRNANPEAARLLGLRLETVRGKSFESIWPKARAMGLDDTLLNVLKSGQQFSSEELHYSGTKKDVVLRFKAFPVSDGRVGVVFDDVGKRQRLEQERYELEQVLSQSQKMQAIGQLAGGVANDLNKLFASLKTYTDSLMGDKGLSVNAMQALEEMQKAIQGATGVPRQLLDFARQGRQETAPVNIHDLLQEVVGVTRRTLPSGIRIAAVSTKARSTTVMGDVKQLRKVFLNIVDNARDAMPDGGEILIEVFSPKESSTATSFAIQETDILNISITDTGCGIPEDVKPHIFDPFFTTKPSGDGVGMGLSMAYGVIQNHSGSLTVESKVGQGTTVMVQLPLASQRLPEEKKGKARPKLLTGDGCILLAEDENTVRMMATAALRKLGYRVIATKNGVECLEAYKKHRKEVDLVLLDLVMPEMGGRDCFHALKEINPHIKTVLATGCGLDPETERLLDEGVLGLISKPYGLSDLSKALHEYMQNEKVSGSV